MIITPNIYWITKLVNNFAFYLLPLLILLWKETLTNLANWKTVFGLTKLYWFNLLRRSPQNDNTRIKCLESFVMFNWNTQGITNILVNVLRVRSEASS